MPRDKARYNERMRDYMRDYRTRESEKDAQEKAKTDDWISRAREALGRTCDVLELEDYRQFINGRVADGFTIEQAAMQLLDTITPPNRPEETKGSCTAADSVLETKPDCFGKVFHKDSDPCDCSLRKECDKEWMMNFLKPQAVKDAERNAKTIAFLNECDDFRRKNDLQDLIKIGAAIEAGKEERQKQLDVLTKKYMDDQGVPEGAARESAEWQMDQEEQARIRKSKEIQVIWDSLSEDEKFQYKMSLWRDNKKLLGET